MKNFNNENSKLTDEKYIFSIELGGNDCDMTWMEDDMDISGDDMVHELFEIYGDGYALEIGDCIFTTDGYDEYNCIKKVTNDI
jgi:hypothetical protein